MACQVPLSKPFLQHPSTSKVVGLRNDEEPPPVPFNGTVREFMYTARQCQTLIGIGEGQYNHRSMPKLDLNALKRFVGLAIFGDKERTPHATNDYTGFDSEELKSICQIVDKIVKENKKFDKHRTEGKGEIHYGACYIYGFEYNKKNEDHMFRIPLFAVYRNKDSPPIYIDENLKVYDNWDCFFDSNSLPLSFLCVPKDGLYTLNNENCVELDFFRVDGYWTLERKMKMAIKFAIAVGSMIFAVYSGPIGWGVELSVMTRLCLGANAIWNGVDVASIALRRDCKNSVRRDGNKQSLCLLLNVASDVLITAAPASNLLKTLSLLLSSYSTWQSGNIIHSLLIESYLKYTTKGFNGTDFSIIALNVANAALLFCNSTLQITSIVSHLRTYIFSKNPPLFYSLPSSPKEQTKLALPYLPLINDTLKSKSFEKIGIFLLSLGSFLEKKKLWKEFKEDAVNVFNELGYHVIEHADELLKKYIKMKTKIDAQKVFKGNIFKICYDIGLTFYDYLQFIFHKEKLNDIEKIQEAICNVCNDGEKTKEFLNSSDEKTYNLTQKFLKGVEGEITLNINKLAKAEILIKSYVQLEIMKKLKDVREVDLKYLEQISEEVIEDFLINKLYDPTFMTELKKKLLDDEKLDDVEKIQEAICNVCSDSEKAKEFFKSIGEKTDNLIEQFIKGIEGEITINIDRIAKAEILIKSHVQLEIIKKLQKVDLKYLEQISEEIIEDLNNKVKGPEAIEEFKKELLKGEKLFSLADDGKNKVYVFKKEERLIDFDSYLIELNYDTCSYEMKKNDTLYIFTFTETDDKVVFFLDDSNPDEVLCYLTVVKSENPELLPKKDL